jgi:hypothetical protein
MDTTGGKRGTREAEVGRFVELRGNGRGTDDQCRLEGGGRAGVKEVGAAPPPIAASATFLPADSSALVSAD